MTEQEFVESADGTRLRLVRLGTGPVVVLVHGTAGGKGDWLPVARRLSASYEVLTFDRRGRGDSGDGAQYALDREVEDVRAVVDAAGGPVHLVGHSFGAILCLLSVVRDPGTVRSLALYEPPLGVQALGERALDGLDAIIASGDLDAAIRSFAAAANITEDELAAIGASEPAWAAMRDGVRAAGREIRAAKAALPVDPADLRSIETPVLVLVGSEQDHASYAGVRELASELPAADVAEVPGRHLAIAFAPDAFASAVQSFFAMSDR